MWLKGTTLLSIPPDRKEKVRGNKTKVRAWGGLGGVALIAGAINSTPLQAASLGTFWAEPESTAPGRDPK